MTDAGQLVQLIVIFHKVPVDLLLSSSLYQVRQRCLRNLTTQDVITQPHPASIFEKTYEVNHSLLTEKLFWCGIANWSLKLLESYLGDNNPDSQNTKQ